jgi:hypothetical protein
MTDSKSDSDYLAWGLPCPGPARLGASEGHAAMLWAGLAEKAGPGSYAAAGSTVTDFRVKFGTSAAFTVTRTVTVAVTRDQLRSSAAKRGMTGRN